MLKLKEHLQLKPAPKAAEGYSAACQLCDQLSVTVTVKKVVFRNMITSEAVYLFMYTKGIGNLVFIGDR